MNDFPFVVERWGKNFATPFEPVAGSLNQIAARAAFRAFVDQEPGGFFRLRHGARVLEQWPKG